MKLEEILEQFESRVFCDMKNYSQFTIDFIQNTLIDLEYSMVDEETNFSSVYYYVDNILQIIKEGIDKELFFDLKLALEDENNRSN